MQNTLLSFLLSFLCLTTFSQNVYVGVPTSVVMDTRNTNLIKNCPSGWITVDNELINSVPSGMGLYFKISASNLGAGCLQITNVGVMDVGDSVLITTAQNEFEWSSLCGIDDYATYEVVLAGTPTTLGDSFYCINQWHSAISTLVDGCTLQFVVNYYTYPFIPECAVQNQSGLDLNEVEALEWSIFPNPSTSEAMIRTNEPLTDARLTLMDFTGRSVLRMEHLNGHEVFLDFAYFEGGTYFVEIVQNGEKTVKKILRLE